MEQIATRIREVFADSVGLDVHKLFAAPLTLSELMACAPQLTNSVDLMEAFAKTAGVIRREFGVRIRLPAMPLETPLEQVLTMFMAEIVRTPSAQVVQDTQDTQEMQETQAAQPVAASH